MVHMPMHKFGFATMEHRQPVRVGIVCPSCESEVSFKDIIEKRGNVRCVNCINH